MLLILTWKKVCNCHLKDIFFILLVALHILRGQQTWDTLHLKLALYDNRTFFFCLNTGFLSYFAFYYKKNFFEKHKNWPYQSICKCVKMGYKCCFGNAACANLKIAWNVNLNYFLIVIFFLGWLCNILYTDYRWHILSYLQCLIMCTVLAKSTNIRKKILSAICR